MLNRLASLPMSTSVLKVLPGKLDIKRHSPSILYIFQLKQVDLNAKVTQLEKQIENLQKDSMGQLRSRLHEVGIFSMY